jgi:hypothetical protein
MIKSMMCAESLELRARGRRASWTQIRIQIQMQIRILRQTSIYKDKASANFHDPGPRR